MDIESNHTIEGNRKTQSPDALRFFCFELVGFSDKLALLKITFFFVFF